jgi:nucleotide sugar dehydrogenase
LDEFFSRIEGMNPRGKHFVIGCTVMPGYTRAAQTTLDKFGATVSYSPEFIAQGSIIRDFTFPDIVLIGTSTEAAGDALEEVYGNCCELSPDYGEIKKMSPVEAEIVKIGVNGYVTAKITYANLVGDLCRTLKANPSRVLEAISADSRIGGKCFRYGYSIGGPCFPRDSDALASVLQKNGVGNSLVAAVNRSDEEHVVYQARELLEQNLDTYVFKGVIYKQGCNIPIIEGSAKLRIGKILAQAGKKVIIQDRIAVLNEVRKTYGDLFAYIEECEEKV